MTTSLKDVAARLNAAPTAEDAALAAEHLNREVPERTAKTSRMVDIDSIIANPSNPRRHIDEAALKQLAESIEAVGILQPLVVRLVAGRWDLVCGHRRLEAARLAKLKQVPVEVRELSDVQVLEVQLVENLQREDIHPLDEAEGFARLRDEAKYTPEQIAQRVGKSVAWVYARLKLTSLAPEARKAFYAGELAASVAVPLARLPHAQQAKALKKLDLGSESPPTVRHQIEWLQSEFCQNLKGAPFDTKDALLMPEAGACTKCPKRSGSTPGLFDDIKESNVCTDVACFKSKSEAAWQQQAEKALAKGHEVLSLSEGAKLYKTGALGYGSRWVEADAPAPNDKQKRTWRELVEKLPKEKRPAITVAPNAKQKPIELYVGDEVTKLAAELGLKWAEQRVERDVEVAKRDDPTERAKEELARAVRERVAQELLEHSGDVAEKEGPTLVLLRTMALMTLSHGNVAERSLERRGVDKPEAWVERKAAAKALFGLLFECVASEVTRDTWSEFTVETRLLAEAVGFDLAAASKAALATAEAEATQPKKGKKS